MTGPKHSLRVLIAKPGLDGHDVGAKLLCRAINDANMTALYTGLRATPETIVQKAKSERADVIGLSILSGAHVSLTERVLEAKRSLGLDDVPVVVGGNIPSHDVSRLLELGARAVFPVGTPLSEITDFLRQVGTR